MLPIKPDTLIVQDYLVKDRDAPFLDKEVFENFYSKIDLKAESLPKAGPLNALTPREIQSIHYLVNGYTAKHIANALNLSHRTIECYIANIKAKLDCYTKSQLIQKLNELMRGE